MLQSFPDGPTLSLQKEALRRVREMQQKAQQSIEQTNAFAAMNRPTAQESASFSPQRQGQPFVPNGGAAQQTASFSQQPPPPQQNMPRQSAGAQQNAAPPFGAQPQQRPQAQQNTRSQNSAAPPFGAQQRPPNRAQGNPQQNTAPQGGIPRGIMDLLSRQGLGGSLGGISESVQSTISSVSQPVADLLESFGIDGEKLIILLIMWAIFNEHQDNKLLLMALGYLLL